MHGASAPLAIAIALIGTRLLRAPAGPDIEEVARVAGLSGPDEVAAAHAGGDYRVFFLGFTGGFPYLGGLPSELTSVRWRLLPARYCTARQDACMARLLFNAARPLSAVRCLGCRRRARRCRKAPWASRRVPPPPLPSHTHTHTHASTEVVIQAGATSLPGST